MTGAIWQYVCGGALVVVVVAVALMYGLMWIIKYSDPENGTPGRKDNDDLDNQG